jgi:hypothetical protein
MQKYNYIVIATSSCTLVYVWGWPAGGSGMRFREIWAVHCEIVHMGPPVQMILGYPTTYSDKCLI